MKRYSVTITREDNLWVGAVDGLPKGTIGVMDFEHFTEIEEGMRELVADLTDTSPDEFEIDWKYDFGGQGSTQLVAEFLEAERTANEVSAWRNSIRQELVRRLNGPLSQRALADLLQISHQRVNQLAKTDEKAQNVARPTPRALRSA